MINISNIAHYAIKNECSIPWVKFFWHIGTTNVDIHYKLLPMDCIDAILNLADGVVYETERNRTIAPPFHINGLRNKYSLIHQEKNIRILGILLYPHGLYPSVHKSLKEVQNKVVNLNGLSCSSGEELKKAVSNETTDKIIAEIENTLIEELSLKQDFMDKAQLISDFITISDDTSIKSFCDERSINIKTPKRMFLYYTGYTPRILCRIKRFQNTRSQLIHQHISLADATYDNNFTDQSYFIKKFTRFSGTALRTFQTEKATVKENVKYKYLWPADFLLCLLFYFMQTMKKQEVFLMSIVTEIVTMRTSQEVTKDSFISTVDSLEKDYHSKQRGFTDTELLYDEENKEWTMIQHWTSMEELKATPDKMFYDERVVPFVRALDAVSVKMNILSQIKIWR